MIMCQKYNKEIGLFVKNTDEKNVVLSKTQKDLPGLHNAHRCMSPMPRLMEFGFEAFSHHGNLAVADAEASCDV